MTEYKNKPEPNVGQLRIDIANIDARLASINSSIEACKNYIRTNIFDRAAVRETEQDIIELEGQADSLRARRANIMKIINQLMAKREQVAVLEQKQKEILNTINACKIYMNINHFDQREVNETRQELEELEAKYAEISYKLYCMKSADVANKFSSDKKTNSR